MLYLHWVTFFPGKWLTEPERAGFLSTLGRRIGSKGMTAHAIRESGRAVSYHN